MKKLLIFTLLFLTINVQSQNFDEKLTDKLDRQIEKYVEGISPGIAVGMVKDGELVYQKYIGYSNLEHEIEIDENTSFNIASNAKQFTALCVLKLSEEGKLNLEDDFRKFLPDLYENIQQKITISNLLTHTSGIRDVYYLWGLKGMTWWKFFMDNSDAIELINAQKDLNFKPGTEYLYSNSNYILLSEIIKNITGEKFSKFAKAMFVELGMPNTGFLTNYMAIIPHKARPYGNWNGWREYPCITEVHGDGALFTTLKDQLAWERIIQLNNGEYFTKDFIDKSQSQIANSIADNYGFGVMFDKYKGLDFHYHNGNTGAYNATFLRFPAENLAIVVNSNNGNVPTNYLAKQLADIALDLVEDDTEYPTAPKEIESLNSVQELLGAYKNEGGTIIRITEKDGSIIQNIYRRKPVQLVSEKGGLFYYETKQETKMNFRNIGKPDQKLTIYRSTQEPSTYHKLPNSDVSKLDKNELNGSFYNEDTDTKILIQFVKDNNYSITKNGRARKAELIVEDYLRMNSYEIKIIRDKENNVVGLNVKNDLIKNVIFNRI